MLIDVGASWHAMVPALAQSLGEELHSPFATGRVLVDSPGAARLLSQAVAAHDGISAGVDYVSPSRWLRLLADEAGIAEAWERWHSSRLVTAIHEQLEPLAHEHEALGRHLADPRRRLHAAARFARLLRAYTDEAPELVAAWLRSEEQSIPEYLSWQPELLRRTTEALGFHPVAAYEALRDVAAADQTPTWWFGLRRVTAHTVPVLHASEPAGAWFVGSAPDWITSPPPPTERAAPTVSLHGSHSQLRQAQVLRDELLRAFDQDPSLEPRDVVVVCPAPAEWAGVLNSVFRGEGTHPGHQLRFAEVTTLTGGNLALEALLMAIEILDARATATQVLEFLAHPAIATRWGLDGHRDDLLTLVQDARISWGLDGNTRARDGLEDVDQGTWLKGLDALLTGVAMGDHLGPLAVTGVDSTISGDLPLIGALSELLSRLRALALEGEAPRDVPAWCRWAEKALNLLVGLGFEDAWMVRAAAGVCERLARSHADRSPILARREFARLLADAAPSRNHRPGLGNGNLHVVAPHELSDVDFPLKVFIGITDRQPGGVPDEIPGHLPDPGERAHADLIAHARSATRIIVVTQTRSARTGAKRETPVTVTRLLHELGADANWATHAPQPFNSAAFTAPAGFDEASYTGAAAALGPAQPRGVDVRRQEVLTRPIADERHTITIAQLQQFLTDPLKAFLRATADVQQLTLPKIDDALPLELGGLRSWKVTDSLLSGVLAGEAPRALVHRAVGSQLAPPGDLGREAIAEAGRSAELLARQAERFQGGNPHRERIELDLGRVQLHGAVNMYGTTIVKVSASGGRKSQLEGWLELLAVTASGQQAEVKIVRPKKGRAETKTLRQPTVAEARQTLELYAHAYVLGRSRLIPAPFEPAFKLAIEVSRGFFRPEEWTDPKVGGFSKWYSPEPLWLLFYDDPTRQFLLDPAQPEDPAAAGTSGFERWARALYLPLTDHGGGF